MRNHEVSEERRAKIREFNEICRLRRLMESTNPAPIQESVTVMYNGRLIDMPKKYVDK